MVVGVPREVKKDEYRVAMLPVGVEELTRRGHRVLIERGAGTGSGIPDEQYAAHGAEIVPDADTVFREAQLIVKVKEPQPEEIARFRPGQMLSHRASSMNVSPVPRRRSASVQFIGDSRRVPAPISGQTCRWKQFGDITGKVMGNSADQVGDSGRSRWEWTDRHTERTTARPRIYRRIRITT